MELNDRVIGELASAHNRMLEERSGSKKPSPHSFTRKRRNSGSLAVRGVRLSFAYLALIAVFAWLSVFIINHISGMRISPPGVADPSRLFHSESPDRIVLAFRETVK